MKQALPAIAISSLPGSSSVPFRATILAICMSFFIFSAGVTECAAQGIGAQAVPAKSTSSLYGLTDSQVTSRFGKPDEVKSKQSGGQEWLYGKSVIFFSDGKVTAWSDAGELHQREKIASLQSEKIKPDDSLSGEWINPWTPPERNKQRASGLEDVINE